MTTAAFRVTPSVAERWSSFFSPAAGNSCGKSRSCTKERRIALELPVAQPADEEHGEDHERERGVGEPREGPPLGEVQGARVEDEVAPHERVGGGEHVQELERERHEDAERPDEDEPGALSLFLHRLAKTMAMEQVATGTSTNGPSQQLASPSVVASIEARIITCTLARVRQRRSSSMYAIVAAVSPIITPTGSRFAPGWRARAG